MSFTNNNNSKFDQTLLENGYDIGSVEKITEILYAKKE
jgi:hypothetical protein